MSAPRNCLANTFLPNALLGPAWLCNNTCLVNNLKAKLNMQQQTSVDHELAIADWLARHIVCTIMPTNKSVCTLSQCLPLCSLMRIRTGSSISTVSITTINVDRYSYKDAYTHSFGCFASFCSLSFAFNLHKTFSPPCAHIPEGRPIMFERCSPVMGRVLHARESIVRFPRSILTVLSFAFVV